MSTKRGFRFQGITACRLAVGVAAWLAIAVMHAPPAAADLSFTLNVDGCSSGCSSPGIPPFGTILLHQVNANTVQVTETLVAGVEFVRTGAGDAIVFDAKAGTTLSAITSGFTQDLSAPPIHVGFFGDFGFGISCSGCGPGGSSPLPGPLSFTASNLGGLLVTDFTANAGGYFFASDIINQNKTSGANTGNVGAKRVPEPASLTILGAAVAGLGLFLRQRRSAYRT